MSSESITVSRVPFWQRQFAPNVSWEQITFDLAAGILLPIFCLLADPIVFRTSSFGPALLGRYSLFAYSAIGMALLGLSVWLLCHRIPTVFTGFLAASALFAVLLGIVLLPFSFLGLFMAGIGVLGFSPFLTAFVYWRNSVRAWARSRQRNRRVAAMVAALVFLAACAGPLLAVRYVDLEISRATELLLSSDANEAARGIAKLRRLRFIADLDKLVWEYRNEVNPVRRTRIEEAYKELTGTEIEHRLAILLD